MIVRALDSNGDWTFGAGLSNYLSGQAAVSQNIQTRLNSFLGDCFFDLGAGIDWFNLLGGKDLTTLNLAVSAVILNTQYVSNLIQLSINVDVNRNVSISYEVQTSFGAFSSSASVFTDYLLTEDGSILDTESGDHIIL